MGDFRIDFGFVTHRKTEKLRRVLGDTAPWHLVCLWSDVAQHHPTGDLAGFDDEDIAAMARWVGEASPFVTALAKCRWIDGVPRAYRMHDWSEHQSWIVTAPERTAKAKRNAAKRWGMDTEDATSMLPACYADAPLPSPPLPSHPIPTKELELEPPLSPLKGGKPDGLHFDKASGSFLGVTDAHRAAWSRLKPTTDIDAELALAAVQWLGGRYKDAGKFLTNWFKPPKVPAWRALQDEAEREWITFLRYVLAWNGVCRDRETDDAYLECLPERTGYAVDALDATRRGAADLVRGSEGYEQSRLKRAFTDAYKAFNGEVA